MMLYLLDTTGFSDLMREHPKMDAHLAGLAPEDRVVICPIVRGEVAYGIARLPEGARRRALADRAARLFANLACEPVPMAAADRYAEVKLARERQGLALDENDLWIASTALALGAVLVSRDTDFKHIDGLTAEDWTA